MPIAIQCPFYQYETRGKYLCEGAEIQFRDRMVRRTVVYTCCADDWHSCPIAKALEKKYE